MDFQRSEAKSMNEEMVQNELKVCLALIAKSADGADPNLTTFNNILASLT